ncbi:MAG: hypothetical protein EPN47_04260 [Acidobacteria bacterium]|nr:MAG: hypothetical protein EPN47_04260 [Acidobacteriota bacterium]
MNRRHFFSHGALCTLLPRGLWAGLLKAQSRVADEKIGFSEFDSEAFAALPIEQPYDFFNDLTKGAHGSRRDMSAAPTSTEMSIPPEGWTLTVPSDAETVLCAAAQEFQSYLDNAMQTRVTLQTRQSLADWRNLRQTIVAGTINHFPGCGASLKGAKDYQITVTSNRIVVCGFDERGVMHGLYNLEARMNLREAPFLPRDLNTTRLSLYRTRMTLSGLGWMEWPDPYLALLARLGFDSIFASVYSNPNGVTGPPPFWDKMKSQDPARMHDLIRRAARYGISVYCPILYCYTGEPDNEAGLRKLVRSIVEEFPEIRGYVLLTEGFFYKYWFDAGPHNIDLRDWIRHWARGISIVVEECHRINDTIEVLPWDYSINFRPDQVEVKKYVIDQLPEQSIPLITFENGKSFTLDGESGYLRDYSINQIGPSEVAAAQIEEAKKRGMRVYAKADAWTCWQFGTFPYLPFPQQWYARYQALEKYGVDGTLESWSYGPGRNFISELRAWYCWTDAPPVNDLLRAIARRDFGRGSEDVVLRSWEHFSAAIKLVPNTSPGVVGSNAVAAPFFFDKPKPRTLTIEHSWTDPAKWEDESNLSPYWPYTYDWLLLIPDFANRVNVAEQYASPFTLQVFYKYLLLAAGEMEKGLESYRRAALSAPEEKKKGAFREVLLAEQLERMMRSSQALLEFEGLRFRLAKVSDRLEIERVLDRMSAIIREEIVRSNAAMEAARRDSRLGYEWEADYVYTPAVIQRKIELLRATLEEQIPMYRRLHKTS